MAQERRHSQSAGAPRHVRSDEENVELDILAGTIPGPYQPFTDGVILEPAQERETRSDSSSQIEERITSMQSRNPIFHGGNPISGELRQIFADPSGTSQTGVDHSTKDRATAVETDLPEHDVADNVASSNIEYIGQGSTAPSPNVIWTAAFYNEIVHGQPDYSDFNAFQQSNIPAYDVLQALVYAASCYDRELGEYSLAMYKAGAIGMQSGIHYPHARFGLAGRTEFGVLADWEPLGEEQRRVRLVQVVADIRLIKAATIHIDCLVRDTRARWAEQMQQQEQEEEEMVYQSAAARQGEYMWYRRCCNVQ